MFRNKPALPELRIWSGFKGSEILFSSSPTLNNNKLGRLFLTCQMPQLTGLKVPTLKTQNRQRLFCENANNSGTCFTCLGYLRLCDRNRLDTIIGKYFLLKIK